MSAAPRRTVVSSYKSGFGVGSNYFACTLTCGHTVTCYGRTQVRGEPMKAPRSASCDKCGRAMPALKEKKT